MSVLNSIAICVIIQKFLIKLKIHLPYDIVRLKKSFYLGRALFKIGNMLKRGKTFYPTRRHIETREVNNTNISGSS